MLIVLLLVAAYGLGSLSSAVIVCHLLKLPDPRLSGSKNPGATNVLRLGGKKAATITLLGDLLKGLIPVCLAKVLGFSGLPLCLVGFAAFLGHLYPLFFGFQGGKGVATFLGILMVLSPLSALAWGLTYLAVAFVFKYSSLASLCASCLTPFYLLGITHDPWYAAVPGLMVMLLFYRHRSNIASLWQGTERKIGAKKTKAPLNH